MNAGRQIVLDSLRRVHAQLNEATREDVFRAVGAAMVVIESALSEFGNVKDRQYVAEARAALRAALERRVQP